MFGQSAKLIVKTAFKAAYLLATPLVCFTLLSGLTAPMLLGMALLFSVPAFLSIRKPPFHWPSIIVAVGSLSAFFFIFFVPVWFAAARAKTPADHLRVGEAYALRGQLFGNDSKTWEHYLIAAEGGDAEAQWRVGTAYLFKHYGAPLDRERARQWLTAATRQGNAAAAQTLNNVDTLP